MINSLGKLLDSKKTLAKTLTRSSLGLNNRPELRYCLFYSTQQNAWTKYWKLLVSCEFKHWKKCLSLYARSSWADCCYKSHRTSGSERVEKKSCDSRHSNYRRIFESCQNYGSSTPMVGARKWRGARTGEKEKCSNMAVKNNWSVRDEFALAAEGAGELKKQTHTARHLSNAKVKELLKKNLCHPHATLEVLVGISKQKIKIYFCPKRNVRSWSNFRLHLMCVSAFLYHAHMRMRRKFHEFKLHGERGMQSRGRGRTSTSSIKRKIAYIGINIYTWGKRMVSTLQGEKMRERTKWNVLIVNFRNNSYGPKIIGSCREHWTKTTWFPIRTREEKFMQQQKCSRFRINRVIWHLPHTRTAVPNCARIFSE